MVQMMGSLLTVAQHKLLVARKLVQLRDQIKQQVLQLHQYVVAIGHVIFSKKIHRCAGLSKEQKSKRAEIKAPSHNGNRNRSRRRPG